MAILSKKEKLEILRDATLEDDVFFSSCLEGSNEARIWKGTSQIYLRG